MAIQYKVNSYDDLNELIKKYNIPLNKIRFFIGEDYKKPKAFGIYQDDNGKWIVYKNKANGQRAIRYEGYDEAIACQEIWDKIVDEAEIRGLGRLVDGIEASKPINRKLSKSLDEFGRSIFIPYLIIGGIILILLIGSLIYNRSKNGYYVKPNSNQVYYYQGYDWYYYDNDDWGYYDGDTSDLIFEHNSNNISSNYNYDDFEDTYYYENYHSSNDGYSSWDNDYDSSWDSWDSSDTNWDSDW